MEKINYKIKYDKGLDNSLTIKTKLITSKGFVINESIIYLEPSMVQKLKEVLK